MSVNLIREEGVWQLYKHHDVLILTDEKQLERIIADPTKPIFYDDEQGHSGEGTRFHDPKETLVTFCERAARRGVTRIEVSYDFFFGGSQRHNYPDSEVTIKAFKVIRDMAKKYGMSFGASLISPLDIGGNYRKTHVDGGIQCQYLEAEILPDGSYHTDMQLQRQWYNNKGPITLELAEVRAYAFNERRRGDTCYFYVNPDEITDITDTAEYIVHEDTVKITGAGFGYGRLEVKGKWENPAANRVLCVALYKTPEIDYFGGGAFDYIKGVIDAHAAAGIDYGGFYSDEMHIQFDWDLGTHFGETEINSRYITPSLAQKYASLYGAQFQDMVKYLIYFSYHQHDFLGGEAGKEPAQHIFIDSDEGIYRTWLFRKRYFELLQSTVVDLSIRAKDYAESLFGAPIMTRAHATWQESPTCDHYFKPENDPGRFTVFQPDPNASDLENHAKHVQANHLTWKKMGISRYEYTPHYDWSSSIRENISACYDYFKWNDFLTGSGNDHPEGSNTDRNYFAQALACSFGALNDYDQAYCASWGSPDEVIHRFAQVGLAYGNPHGYNLEQGMQHRITDVLALYPLELNYVEERYGSWLTQYGYCNYITEEKLLQNAVLTDDGKIRIRDFTYNAVMVMFEPFISEKTMKFLSKFLKCGGKVLWTATYPVLSEEGNSVYDSFKKMFGIKEMLTSSAHPIKAGGREITFAGSFADIPPMPVITDLLPDYVYSLEVCCGEEVAFLDGKPVASLKRYPGGGVALYAGFRPRDDQSMSLDYDVDTLFCILERIGAYTEGSLEAKSRPKDAKYVMNQFPNGAVAIANHYRTFEEAWDGPFFRNQELDKCFLAGRELPPLDITLKDEEIRGHKVTYSGSDILIYNLQGDALTAYRGHGTDRITIDGRDYIFADRNTAVSWGKIRHRFLADGIRELYILICHNEAKLSLPLPEGEYQSAVCKTRLSQAGDAVPAIFENGALTLQITPDLKGKYIAIYR